MKSVAHIVGPSHGGMRRHVAYLAAHPPFGFESAGVWGPSQLREYFTGLDFHVLRRTVCAPVPGADVVHAHGFTVATAALRRRRPPVVLTAHVDIRTQGRPAQLLPLRSIARLIARRADAVIAVSERVAKEFPGSHVIGPAVAPLPPPVRSRADVRSSLGATTDGVVVIAVARLHRDKGLDAFVRAVVASGAEGWICGDGPETERIARLAHGSSVRLLGYRDDVADLLAAADVFALPSVGEAYGIAVAEALAAGVPVIATDAGAMPEIVGDAGVIVPPSDEFAFTAAVRDLVHDSVRRDELAARARRKPRPSPADLVARVGRVYEDVCS
jgi:glycosyltransferase involved in cell wall biosynthesis